MAAVNRPEVLSELRASRLTVVLDSGERQALLAFVRDNANKPKPYANALRKKALLRIDEGGRCHPWSPLVFDILTYKLLYEQGHDACRFLEESHDALMTHLAKEIKAKYSKWVWDLPRKQINHDDEINGVIASILKGAIGSSGLHRGPAKQCNKKQYSQVDHAIYWNNNNTPTLIETCLRDLARHVDRFDPAKGGTYSANYRFGVGIILFVSQASNPRTVLSYLPPNTVVFHLSVPSFASKKLDSTTGSWEEFPKK